MDFYIDLNEDREYHWRTERKIAMAGSIALLVICALNIAAATTTYSRALYTLMLLLYIAAFTYSYRIRLRTKYYVRSDEQIIEYKLHAMDRLKQQLLWDSIERVKFGATYVAFYKRTGKRKLLKMGWLTYDSVIRIKRQLQQACAERDIPYEVAQIYRG